MDIRPPSESGFSNILNCSTGNPSLFIPTGLGNRSKVETIFQKIVFLRSFKDGLRIQEVMEVNLLMLDNCLILQVLRIQTGQAGQNISSIHLYKIDT